MVSVCYIGVTPSYLVARLRHPWNGRGAIHISLLVCLKVVALNSCELCFIEDRARAVDHMMRVLLGFFGAINATLRTHHVHRVALLVYICAVDVRDECPTCPRRLWLWKRWTYIPVCSVEGCGSVSEQRGH
jgi:hypothetical protein